MTLTVHLLGQPELFFDSAPLKFNAPPKTLPLLAYLLLHRRQVLERQHVAMVLWPDDLESDARANLRRHLHQLQRCLPPASPGLPWLAGDARTVGWNPSAPLWLDVAEFERLSEQPAGLEEAAACYTGDLLETIYDDWVFFERERLRSLYFDVLTRLVFQRRLAGDYPKAMLFARQLLARDPFREDAVRQLMALRYASGDRAGAIQEYEAFDDRLRAEMGVAPMSETQALYEQVLQNASLPGLGDRQPPALEDGSPPPRSAPLLPFTGREAEMEQAAAWWSRAACGRGGLALIGGEAGVGKTRLARQAALLAESQGGRVLVGHTPPGEPHPYQAVVEALGSVVSLLAALKMEPVRLAALAALLSELKTRRRLPVLPALDPDRERLRLFDAVAGCLGLLAGPRPLLLVLEDLHWAGEATLGLVEFLARRAAGSPLLILGVYRDEDARRDHPLRQARRRLQAEGLVAHLALGRLSPQAVDCLLAGLPDDRLPTGLNGRLLSDRLYAESEGNPLFIEMLLQSWREGVPPEHGLDGSPRLPGGVRQAVTRRLERLPADSRAYAETAAVLGPAFEAEAAREVGGWDEAQAYTALQGLLDARLVRESEGRSRFDYSFAHHLIQTALYDGLPPARRKRRHRRAAEVLESLYPDRREELAGELAVHYDRGAAPAQAIACYQAAACQRAALFADAEALAALDRALQLAGETPAATSRLVCDLLLLRESISHRRGEPQEQLASLNRLEDLAAALDDAELVAEVLKRWFLYYTAIDDYANKQRVVAALQRQAQAMGSRRWQAEAVFAEGYYLLIARDYPAAIACLQEALDLYEALQDARQQVMCCCYLAQIFIDRRQSAAAGEWAQKALALCGDEAPTPQVMNTLWTLSANSYINQDLEQCLSYGQRLLAATQRAGDRFWEAAAQRLTGMACRRQFHLAEARRRLNSALELYRLAQKPKGCALTLQSFGELENSVGDYAAAGAYHRQAFEIGEQIGDIDLMAAELINLACVAAFQQDFAGEAEYARRAVTFARQVQNRYLEALALQNLGEAARELGDLEAAFQRLDQALGLLSDPSLIAERLSLYSDLALAHAKAGRLDLAVQDAEQVLALYPQVEGTDDNLHSFLWAAARALRTAGQLEQAAQALDQAYRAFQEALAALPDAAARQTFSQIPHNRQIAAAYQRGEWP